MSRYCVVYVTAGNEEEATALGEAAVAARLAACANVIPGMRSVYWWEGKLERAGEAILILKTRTDLVPALRDEIRSRHSYQVPAFLVVPLDQVEPTYASWMESVLRPSG
ncbi:MAG: divalent-cation tolerance protein CutA [Firmicutes bacterium]|nr:divalent-cation tolerance protein CutA [Bacillota bacterium]